MIQKRSIPSLDGLRTLSIGLVIVNHIEINIYHNSFEHMSRFENLMNGLFQVGHLGVMVFFVISGFLITSIICKDTKVDLKKFYFRRVLRIFPPYYFYLSAILILWIIGVKTSYSNNLISSACFAKNYYFDSTAPGAWNLEHTWSLSVEEQFYILFPIALYLLGNKMGKYFIIAVILACPVFRLIKVISDPSSTLVFYRFELIADSLAVGCLLALTREKLHANKRYIKFLRSWLTLAMPVIAVLISWLIKFPAYCPREVYSLVAISVQNFCIVLFLDRVVTFPDSRVGNFLNSRPMVFIGVMSYSIYLWQQIFLDPNLQVSLILKIAGIIVSSLASYYLIERSSLILRQRLEKRFAV